MNLILLSKDDFIDPGRRVRLTGRRHKHIREILKSSIGDELCVGLLGDRIGKGRVLAIDDKAVEMEISLETDPPRPVPITLVLALPRPIVLKRVLSHVTALGIKKIILIQTERVEKSYWNSPALKEESIRTQLMLGLEQAKDTIMPEVLCRTKFKPFAEDELPSLIRGTRAFLADPEAEEAAPCGNATPATLVIGTEGGFLPNEAALLKRAGCESVRFGKRILRVETAVIAAIARLAP
ncbi:MAG: 16S rRNA (uracil(1498)-N(3))-methyltransferase [Candidatus Omnitrophota bacterium]